MLTFHGSEVDFYRQLNYKQMIILCRNKSVEEFHTHNATIAPMQTLSEFGVFYTFLRSCNVF